MAYERLGGIARVTTDPNTIPELQSGHTIQKAKLVSDGTEWTYIASNLAGSRWVLDVSIQDETEVPLVNTYANIKKIENAQVLEGDVNIDYTPGYFYAENYNGNLDPNSELFNLQVGDTIYFEGLDGNIGSVVIDDYVYADPINLELEFASQTPALILDHNGNPISDTDPNWSDGTFANSFNVYIESPVESTATTVADALSYLDSLRIPNFSNGLIFNEANGEAEVGGDFNRETTINTNGFGFNLLGNNTSYNFGENFAGMSVDGFINIQSLNSGFTFSGLGGQGNVIAQGLNLQNNSPTSALTLNSQSSTIISAQGDIILNKFGNTPSIGDVWTAIGTGGQGQWETPETGADFEDELLLINDYRPTLFMEPLTLVETQVATGVRVNFSGGQVGLPLDQEILDVLALINRPEEEIITARFVHTPTGNVGYVDINLNTYNDGLNSSVTSGYVDYFVIEGGGSSSYSYYYYGGGVTTFNDVNGNPVTNPGDYPDDFQYEMFIVSRVGAMPLTQEDYNLANVEKLKSLESGIPTASEISTIVDQSLGDYVPYIGATQNVNLGENDLISGGAYFTGVPGGSNMFVIKSSSLNTIDPSSFDTFAVGLSVLNGGTSFRGNILGRQAGLNATLDHTNALGPGAARDGQGDHLNLLGDRAGEDINADYVNAFGDRAGSNSTGNHCTFFGALAGFGNSAINVTAIGNNSGVNNSLGNTVILGPNAITAYADRAAAVAGITTANGAVAGNHYLYLNQTTNNIEFITV